MLGLPHKVEHEKHVGGVFALAAFDVPIAMRAGGEKDAHFRTIASTFTLDGNWVGFGLFVARLNPGAKVLGLIA